MARLPTLGSGLALMIGVDHRLTWTFARGVRTFTTAYRESGPATALAWVITSSLRPARFIGLAASPETWQRPDGRLDLEIWPRERVAAWRAPMSQVPVAYMRDEIDGVEHCAVGLAAGEVVALIWVYPSGSPSRFFRLHQGEVELNHGFVGTRHRGRGYFTHLLRFAAGWCLDRGARRVVAAVDETNAASLHGFRGAGFRDFDRVTHLLTWRPKFREVP